MKGSTEANKVENTTGSSQCPLVVRSKDKNRFTFGITSMLLFMCAAVVLVAYDFTVSLLSAKTLFDHMDKQEILKKELTNIQEYPKHGESNDSPQRTPYPHATSFKRLYQYLIPAHRRCVQKLQTTPKIPSEAVYG